MSRFLEPAAIQALSYDDIPRVKLPQREGLFAARASRLRALAKQGGVISGYLALMADLSQAQHAAIMQLETPLIAPAISTGECRQDELVPAPTWSSPNPAWKDVLRQLIHALQAGKPPEDSVHAACAYLATLDDDTLEQLADNVQAMRHDMVDSVSAPLVAAALQVAWVDAASRLDERQVPYPDSPGICPVCGSVAIASIVRIGGREDGYRFVVCGLCATESHVVRVKCSSCESTRGLFYQLIDGRPDWVKAESCDECHAYRKIFYQARQHEVEPFVDDLATLELDIAMSGSGYGRPAAHPFLWPATHATVHA